MQNQIEQSTIYELIKSDYEEALIILNELKKEKEDERIRSQRLFKKEM